MNIFVKTSDERHIYYVDMPYREDYFRHLATAGCLNSKYCHFTAEENADWIGRQLHAIPVTRNDMALLLGANAWIPISSDGLSPEDTLWEIVPSLPEVADWELDSLILTCY